MNVLLVASRERRQRYLFVAKPLELTGSHVEVLKTSPMNSFVARLLNLPFQRPKPDLMILMGAGIKDLIAYIVAKIAGICVIARLGGDRIRDQESVGASCFRSRNYMGWLKCRLNMWLALVLLKRVDALIAVNPGLARRLEERFGNVRVFIVPQCCDGAAVEHQYTMAAPLEILTVVNLRFSEKANGVIWLIENMNAADFTHDVPINYRVVGSGMHLKDIETYLANAKIRSGLNVHLEGFHEDLDRFYRAADVFLYHSTHDATPNTILESKKYGLPLIANDCDEFRAIIDDGVSGLLYSDASDFQRSLETVIRDSACRTSLGMAAGEEHVRKYSVAAIAGLLDEGVLNYVRSCGK